jgi:ribosomal protein S27E
MNVRCPFCRHNFNLTRDYVEMAVKEAQEEGQKYHAVECANCRKTIKVPIKQMKRYLPREKR